MAYRYHAQRQAEQFARQILPVPETYPLKPGLDGHFRDSFSRLCELAKRVYLDMAEAPEAYGLMLLDIAEQDHNLARDSYRSVHRFVDTLNALFVNGKVSGHSLQVDAARFRTAIRKLPPVPRYGLVLSRLCRFGFAFSEFDGTTIPKKVESFTVEYPEDPEMIDTLKIYCDCWKALDQFRNKDNGERNELILLSPQEFHHHFYRFDYKITADLTRLSVLTWLGDEAAYQGFDEQLKRFQEAFFGAMQQFEGVKFDGSYHFKGKRVARITQQGYTALGTPDFVLSLKLRDIDRYREFAEGLPGGVREPLTKDSCRHCGFQNAAGDNCKFRLHWTLLGVRHTGCAYWSFVFRDFSLEAVPCYAQLLALEYGLKKRSPV